MSNGRVHFPPLVRWGWQEPATLKNRTADTRHLLRNSFERQLSNLTNMYSRPEAFGENARAVVRGKCARSLNDAPMKVLPVEQFSLAHPNANALALAASHASAIDFDRHRLRIERYSGKISS